LQTTADGEKRYYGEFFIQFIHELFKFVADSDHFNFRVTKGLMKQNMQTVNKHKFKSAQYSYICGDCPTNESQGEAQGGFYM
jgi:uncharacterized protein (DUF2252 family)